ncbi:MAG: putative fusion protein (N:peptidase-C:desuccinylase) [Parcubacteria group bacterium Gr01-1014_13]|nr:MAG: putative fusion protein (N:peptidase-C:desuccinylase) [Parcubacteria group bacterium Gr01-1014_13]
MLRVLPFRQSSGFCGPASLKMVLEYFGIKKSEKELAKLSNAHPHHGTSAKNLVLTAKKLGLKGFYKDFSSIKEIKKYLDKKIPVIVDWFSHDDGHYSVVIGIDKKFIYLQDPELGKINKIDLVTFQRIWFDFEEKMLNKKQDIFIRRLIVIYR